MSLKIPKGRYLKFVPQSTEENKVWTLWEQVWTFFSKENQIFERAYIIYYEVFYPNKDIELYIAIK